MRHDQKTLQVGQFWQHFKGKVYEIVGFAQHTEDDERLVLYVPAKGINRRVWARPEHMWTEPAVVKSTEPGEYACLHSMQDHTIVDGKMICLDCQEGAARGRFIQVENPQKNTNGPPYNPCGEILLLGDQKNSLKHTV